MCEPTTYQMYHLPVPHPSCGCYEGVAYWGKMRQYLGTYSSGRKESDTISVVTKLRTARLPASISKKNTY